MGIQKTTLKKRAQAIIMFSTVIVMLATSFAILAVLNKAINAMCSLASSYEAHRIEEKISSSEFLKAMHVSDLNSVDEKCVLSDEVHQQFNEEMKNGIQFKNLLVGKEHIDKMYAEIKINGMIIYTNIPSGFHTGSQKEQLQPSQTINEIKTGFSGVMRGTETIIPIRDSRGNKVGSIFVVVNPEILSVFSRPVVISILITLMVSLCASYALAMLLTKPLVKPLEQLSDKLTALSEEDNLDVLISDIVLKEPLAEIGELATSANRIIEKVRRSNQEITDQNMILEHNNNVLDLMNKELAESRDELRDLNATKDKFFSIISHDLKGPFNGMIGLSGMLITMYDSLTDEEVQEYVQDISNSAKGIYKLLDNLLLWAGTQSGRLQFKPEKICMNELVISNFEALDAIAKSKNIQLKHDINKNIYTYADAPMITTVLRNLISNALKFTYSGGEIQVSALEIRDDYVQVWVADNGKGIDRANLENLFRIDTKVISKGTANETGTGLGLILCKEFVEKNGGEIWVESEIGKGTVFKFSVPIYSGGPFHQKE